MHGAPPEFAPSVAAAGSGGRSDARSAERTTMATCPACGIEAVAVDGECPRCHLSAALFDTVREAAGPGGESDPAYLRTIGELIATVDLAGPAPAATETPRSPPGTARPFVSPPEPPAPSPPARAAPPMETVLDFPPAPTSSVPLADLQRRFGEYFQLGRRLGLDFTDFESRAHSASLVDDVDSLDLLAREMFVHLSSAIAEEFESAMARRNELAQLIPTASADVELTAVRRAIGVGDLGGAQRRLSHVRDALTRAEEEWEVGRILVTEGELMVTTIRELGGDPAPAAGPLEEGRRLFVEGRRTEAERVLARAAVALWSVLQPRLLAELRRLRDRMLEQRSSGLDIEPGVHELRGVSVELQKRNFVGTIVAYRRLRSAVDRTAPSGLESVGGSETPAELRTSPPA